MILNLETKNTALHLITLNDLDHIHELHTHPKIDVFNTLGIPEDKAQTQQLIQEWISKLDAEESKTFTWKITIKKSTSFAGLIGLHLSAPKFKSAEVWYKIHPKFWNKGIATTALNSVLNFGFNRLKLHRIEAGCAVENAASIRVLEKVGMLKEGRKRKILPLKNGWSDNFHYALLESDFNKTSKP